MGIKFEEPIFPEFPLSVQLRRQVDANACTSRFLVCFLCGAAVCRARPPGTLPRVHREIPAGSTTLELGSRQWSCGSTATAMMRYTCSRTPLPLRSVPVHGVKAATLAIYLTLFSRFTFISRNSTISKQTPGTYFLRNLVSVPV